MKKTKLKHSKVRLLSFFMFVLLTSMSFSQGKVTGTITDNSGTPVPGVNILETGTNNGTVTDFDGNFSITLQKNTSELEISFLGFKSQQKTASAGDTLTIVMQEDLESLNEVIVVGYGTSKRSDLTMAVSSVSSKSFEKQPLFRAEDALQSRAAGVQVTKTSGAPGGGIKIRIRGTNSITRGNNPLVVIDGVIGGDLSTINPNDIKSLNILKDASASAIYGARGANGVILITTKKGTGVAKLDVNYFTSISSIPKRLPVFSPQQYADINGTPAVVDGGTDYQDEFFQTAILNNLQLSASGKEGKLSYFLSGNYVDQEGIVINTDYERFSLRANLETRVGDNLKIGLNIYGAREKRHNLFNGGSRASSDNRGGVLSILTYDPTYPVRNADGTYNQLQSSYGSILVNPIAVITEKNNNNINDRFNINLNLSYDFSPAFNYTLIAGNSIGHSNSENYALIPDGSSVIPPRASFSSSNLTRYQLSNVFSYNKDIGNTKIKLTGIYEVTKSQIKSAGGASGAYSQDGLDNAFYLLELGTNHTINANQIESTVQSFVGRAEVSIAQNLFITGILRVDQSSTFRKENRTGYFPSVSAAYSIKDWLPEDGLFNNIKLRGGYGEVGNDNIPALSTYSQLVLGTNENYAFDGVSSAIGLDYAGQVDADLKWETTKQFNVGLDFTFLNNKLNLSIDWYKKNTVDLLLNAPLPYSSGDPNGQYITNIGEVENTGIDLSLDANIIDKNDLYWNANFNLSTTSNKIISLGGVDQILVQPDGIRPGGGQINTYAIEVGKPLGQMYGATFLGTWKTADAVDGEVPGSPKYLRDSDGENVLGVIGNGIPQLTWGFNNTFSYKGFDLNVLLRGVHDFDVYNVTYSEMVGRGKNANHVDFLNRWTPTNETETPSVLDNVLSDRYIEKGGFVRLSNITLGYTFKNIKLIQSLKVHVSGQNLFTITDYTGFDPEVSATSNGTDLGPSLDYGAYPNPRTVTLGVNIGF